MIGRNANVGDQLLLGLRRGQCSEGEGMCWNMDAQWGAGLEV